jgi:hypothetical protein
MLKFIRVIRQKLVNENNISKYLVYALGEIILVVIGILIALSINTWNENNKNAKLEKSFLINLHQDVVADSISLSEIINIFTMAVQSKKTFEDIAQGKQVNEDSLGIHFRNQYNTLVEFIPHSTTIDELTSSGGLTLISNPQLRRELVSLYNNYDDLKSKISLGKEKHQLIMRYVSGEVENIFEPSSEELLSLMKDPYFVNQLRINYLVTQMNSMDVAYAQCLETLALLNKEISEANIRIE